MKFFLFPFGFTILLWLCQSSLFAQQIQNTIPGFSLARRYQNQVLQKAGDFNKSHIRVLTIVQNGKIVGLKAAGHSEQEICEQASKIFARLCNELAAKGLKFGNIGLEPTGFYFGYGVFDSPIDPKFTELYEKYTAELKAVADAHPGMLVIRSIEKNEFDRHVAVLKNNEQRANGQNLFAYHQFPENFFVFAPVQQWSNEQEYAQLVKMIREKAGTKEALDEIAADAALLKEIFDEITNTYLPYAYRAIPNGLEQGKRKPTDKAIIDEAFKEVRHVYANDVPHSLLQPTKKLIERIANREKRLSDDFLRLSVKNWIDYARLLTNNDSLKNMIRQHPEFMDMVSYPQTGSIEIKILWQPPAQNETVAMLKTYYANMKVYLELAKQMAEQHPYMLADAALRRWPSLSITKYKKVYEKSIEMATMAGMKSEFQFVAPRDNSAEILTSVSGRIFQAVDQGKSQYYNYEEFVSNESVIPAPIQIMYALLNMYDSPKDARFSLPQISNGTPVDMEAFTQIANLPLETLENIFIDLPPAERLAKLQTLLKNEKITFENAPNLYSLPEHRLMIQSENKSETNFSWLTRFTEERIFFDPDFVAETGVQPLTALGVFVLRNDDNNLDMAAEYLGKGQRATLTAPVYRKFNLSLAKYYAKYAQIEKADPNEYLAVHHSLNVAMQNRGRESTAEERKVLELLKELAASLAVRTDERKPLLLHNPNPKDVFWAADGKTLLLSHFITDKPTTVGLFMGQILAHSLALSEPANQPLAKDKAVAAAKQWIDETIKAGLLDESFRQSPQLLAEMALGVAAYGETPYPLPKENQKITESDFGSGYQTALLQTTNIRQPLFIALLQAAEQSPQSGDVKSRASALKKAAETLPAGTVFLKLCN